MTHHKEENKRTVTEKTEIQTFASNTMLRDDRPTQAVRNGRRTGKPVSISIRPTIPRSVEMEIFGC